MKNDEKLLSEVLSHFESADNIKKLNVAQYTLMILLDLKSRLSEDQYEKAKTNIYNLIEIYFK